MIGARVVYLILRITYFRVSDVNGNRPENHDHGLIPRKWLEQRVVKKTDCSFSFLNGIT